MRQPRRGLRSLFASLTVLTTACTQPAVPDRAASPAPTAPTAAAAAGCLAPPGYTAVEIGPTQQTTPKQVATNCWWQAPVDKIFGRINQPLGWQVCNTCAVDIEFQWSDVAAGSLTQCGLWFDASGSATKTVRAGQTETLSCTGASTVTDTYNIGARQATTTGPFVPSDPELEIADVGFEDYRFQLARITELTICRTNTASGSTRLVMSGLFAATSAASSITYLQSPLGLSSTRWGGDLLESTPVKAPPPPSGPLPFSLATELPDYVTDFSIRPYGTYASAWQRASIPVCR